MKKIYFNQIHISTTETIKLVTFRINQFNELQKEGNNWIKGAKRIRPTHLETYKALLQLLMKKEIYRRNKANQITGESYNINEPLTCMVHTSDIKNMALRGLKNGVCSQTLKNYMDRLEDFGFIKRRWKREGEKFEIEFSPENLVLIEPETGIFIKNIGFENYCYSINYESKNENFKDNTNQETKIKNKLIHLADVDKKDSLSRIASSSKNEHLKTNEQKVQGTSIHDICEQMLGHLESETALTKPSLKNELRAAGRENLSKNAELQDKKRNAAIKFYELFIAAFWNHLINFYMPKLAPKETIHFVEQAIETLINDPFYFGSCTDNQSIEYQYNKLHKALKSSMNWFKKKKKFDANFTFDKVYPNVFLKTDAGTRHMSFKNAVLHMEKFMAVNNEMQMENEKKLQRERDKAKKDRFNHIVSQLIAYIMLNPKDNTKKLTTQAFDYLIGAHPEMAMKLQTDIGNPYLVKEILKKHKSFDNQLITDCFASQEKIESEINRLLPVMQKQLLSNKLKVNQQILIRFNIRGNQMQPIPKMFDNNTLKFIKSYLKY